jgi:hypothetical protein
MAQDETQGLIGRQVWATNGRFLGRVVRTTPGHFVVERGFFFMEDFEIPLEEIASSAVDTLHLRRDDEEYRKRFAPASPEQLPPQRAYPFTEADLTSPGPTFDSHGRELYPGTGYPVTSTEEDWPKEQPSPPKDQ